VPRAHGSLAAQGSIPAVSPARADARIAEPRLGASTIAGGRGPNAPHEPRCGVEALVKNARASLLRASSGRGDRVPPPSGAGVEHETDYSRDRLRREQLVGSPTRRFRARRASAAAAQAPGRLTGEPSALQGGPVARAAQGPTDLIATVFPRLAAGVLSGVGSKAGGAALGWVLSAFGLRDDNDLYVRTSRTSAKRSTSWASRSRSCRARSSGPGSARSCTRPTARSASSTTP
jgi:hypothetical protein